MLSGGVGPVEGETRDIREWNALLARQGAPWLLADDAEEFHGQLWLTTHDRVSVDVIRAEASRHAVHRTAALVRRDDSAQYMVAFQLEGRSVFRQAGSTAALEPGDFTVATSLVPFDWEFDGDFALLSMRYPQTAIDAPALSLLPMTGQRLTLSGALGEVLLGFVRSIAERPELLGGPLGERVAGHLVDLVTTNVIARLEEAGEGRTAPAFVRVTEWISRHLTDPRLTPAAIAAANFMSVRSLHALFRQHGTSVAQWVRQKRLDQVRRELADPQRAEATIGELAMMWGFEDQTNFGRLFRRAYGETPRQWRVRAAVGVRS